MENYLPIFLYIRGEEMQNITFDSKHFCPNLVDKSTPLKKYLYCTKIKGLCKMVTYFPSGQIVPKKDVQNTGCPYGYVIQDISQNIDKNIKKGQVTKKNNVLDDISMKDKKKDNTPKQTSKPKVEKKDEVDTVKKNNSKKKNTKKKTTKRKKKE